MRIRFSLLTIILFTGINLSDSWNKGISSIGGATVLHTEGWVFKSLIPYNITLYTIILIAE